MPPQSGPPYRWEFDGPQWLTPQQVAEKLGLSLPQEYWRCRRGQIPATRDRSNLWHVHRDDLKRVRAMPWYQASIARKA